MADEERCPSCTNEPFQIVCPAELPLFQCVGAELYTIAGVWAEYYHFNEEQSETDLLYDETTDPIYDKYNMRVLVKYDRGKSFETEEMGANISYEAECYFNKKLLDQDSVPYPVEGDAIFVWNRWWDIYEVQSANYIDESDTFLDFACRIRIDADIEAKVRIGKDVQD